MAANPKKRLDVLQKRLTRLRQQLSGATRQNDEPQETARLRVEVQAVEEEIRKVKEQSS